MSTEGALNTRYYAVPDPDTGDMTFWYRNKKGKLGPWPTRPKPHYGPTLWMKMPAQPGPHDYVVPDELNGETRHQWATNWYRTVSHPWHARIREEIERDPETCMARFASIGYRCSICGKTLADEESRISAIGPECRKQFPESFVVQLRQMVSRVAGREGT